MTHALLVEKNKERIFEILKNGDIILRGNKIGNDIEVAEMFKTEGAIIYP